ncbi:MAG: twin-arginine translocation signal domain-containing protein, partial [Rhodospirillaceae bacterium]
MKTKKPTPSERRNFLKTIGGATAAMAALPAFANGQ